MRAPLPAFAALGLVVLAASCGSSSREPRATVTVLSSGQPVAGVTVVFHRPDGSVQETAATDDAGRASAVVPPDALVTVARVRSDTDGTDLATITGVQPGDALHVVLDASGGVVTGAGALALAGPVGGASSYTVDVSCTVAWADRFDAAPVFQLWSGCGASLDALAIARAPDGAPLAWASALGVPVTGTPPAQSATGALGAWRTDFATLALEATNAPPGAQRVFASLALERDGREFPLATGSAAAEIAPGAAAALSIPHAPGFATAGRLRTTVSFGPAGAPDAGEAWVVERGLPLAARTVDLAAALPPRLSSLSLARADGRLVAAWSKAGADPALDGAILSIRWLASGARSWAVVLPPGTTSFAFPRLPPALAEFAPAPQVQPAVSVSAYGFEETRGWDEFRTTAPVESLGSVLVVLDLSMDRGAWTSSGSILPEIVPVPAALRTPAAAAVHPATAAAR